MEQLVEKIATFIMCNCLNKIDRQNNGLPKNMIRHFVRMSLMKDLFCVIDTFGINPKFKSDDKLDGVADKFYQFKMLVDVCVNKTSPCQGDVKTQLIKYLNATKQAMKLDTKKDSGYLFRNPRVMGNMEFDSHTIDIFFMFFYAHIVSKMLHDKKDSSTTILQEWLLHAKQRRKSKVARDAFSFVSSKDFEHDSYEKKLTSFDQFSLFSKDEFTSLLDIASLIFEPIKSVNKTSHVESNYYVKLGNLNWNFHKEEPADTELNLHQCEPTADNDSTLKEGPELTGTNVDELHENFSTDQVLVQFHKDLQQLKLIYLYHNKVINGDSKKDFVVNKMQEMMNKLEPHVRSLGCKASSKYNV